MNPSTVVPWHGQEGSQVLAAWHSSIATGLSAEKAQERLACDGPNRLPEALPRSPWALLVDQFRSLPVALLTLAAGISYLTTGWADALVIMGVVVINGGIGYFTERQSDRIIRSLEQASNPTAWVRRDATLMEIDAEAVVPGDLLVLRPGSAIVADGRLVEAQALNVDESALTGESLPVAKTEAPLTAVEVPLGDRTNMVYRGTLVTGGQGLAVVVATATATEMGRIQALVGQATPPPTPMERQLDQAGSQLVWLSSAVCILVFGLGLWRGYPLLEMLKTSVALAVAAVPEGLPAVATTTLALGLRALRQQKVLIRQLDAVETLGSLQTLCLDKTGTLTTNHMAVVELQTDHIRLRIPEALSPGEAMPAMAEADPVLKLLQVVVLCNESEINGGLHQPTFSGSSTENALLELALKASLDVPGLRQTWPVVAVQHRSAHCNWMKTLHTQRDGALLMAVKGNPLEVLALCDRRLEGSGVVPLTEVHRLEIAAENERLANDGLRILGVAYGEPPSPTLEAEIPLVWLGLVGLADPLRSGVKAAIAAFHRAGVATVMVTGDQRPTAAAIGQALNLSQGKPLRVVDATDLPHLPSAQALALGQTVHIFSRISPANKLQVVQALQRAGQVVAMTGDGINDTPALKAAEVGIAMGHSGTEAARAVADVVLEDDNLATLVMAIRQGRTIYGNIRKAVHFLLSTNLSEIMVMFAGIGLGLGQPLNALQLLWLNLVTDIFPGLALALEPAEDGIMAQPPRDPKEPIIQPAAFRRMVLESMVLSASSLGAYAYGLGLYGVGPQASTIGFMSLTLAQLLHALSCRSPHRCLVTAHPLPPNHYLAIALSLSLTLQFLALFIPPLGQLLHMTRLTFWDVMAIVSSALLPLAVNEATKPPESRALAAKS